MAMKTRKNLLGSSTVYNAYYGDFRGVDFSSDHTQVSRARLAYSVNMYKDYRSGQGQCIETIPGFRRRFTAPNGKPIYGVHTFGDKVLIHAGNKLYKWDSGGHDIGVTAEDTLVPTAENTEVIGTENGVKSVYITLGSYIADVTKCTTPAGDILEKALAESIRTAGTYFYNAATHKLRLSYYADDEPDRLFIEYKTDPSATELTPEDGDTEIVPIPTLTASFTMTPTTEFAETYKLDDVGEITSLTVTPDPTGDYPPLKWSWDFRRRTLTLDFTDPEPEEAPMLMAVAASENSVYTVTYTYKRRQSGMLDLSKEAVTDKVMPSGTVTRRYEVKLPETVSGTPAFYIGNTLVSTEKYAYSEETRVFSCPADSYFSGKKLKAEYIPRRPASLYAFGGMNEQRSVSFICANRLYILDGKNYLIYDGEKLENALSTAYIPTTYINAIPAGDNADIGTEYEARNLLSPFFKQTFIGDAATKTFILSYRMLDDIAEVRVNGEKVTAKLDTTGSSYGYDADVLSGSITFTTAPAASSEVEVTMRKKTEKVSGIENADADTGALTVISGCTIATVYDNRVFLSGNPRYPNHIFWSGINSTGYNDPTYFGELNYVQDGVGLSPVTGMIPLADALMVLKNDDRQDGSVYYHTPTETGKDLLPKTYPSTKGLNGVGCLGACMNFLDDPVFVSKMGLEAIGQLSVRYERALEHRSSLVDAKLINLDLAKASLEVWNGYLMLLCDGKIFMADSRQRYTNDSSGNMQYEWYYLEDIAVYEGQETEYIFSSSLGDLAEKQIYFAVCPMCGMDAEPGIPISLQIADKVYNELLREYNDKCGLPVTDSGYWLYDNALMYYYENGSKVYFRANVALSDDMPQCIGGGEHPSSYTVYLCETHGNKTGGKQKKATVLKAVGDNLFFGTENGVLCSFNFDKRDEDGEIAPKYYSFDGRTILCGCATKMDCCDIPHLTKNTVKKSTVIKTKAMARSAAKVKVRTNKKPYNQIARINSARFAFDDMDFSDFTFETMDKSLYSVKEKEKKWVEKQYYIYSDEYCKPFSLYYISYRYTVAGRYKE